MAEGEEHVSGGGDMDPSWSVKGEEDLLTLRWSQGFVCRRKTKGSLDRQGKTGRMPGREVGQSRVESYPGGGRSSLTLDHPHLYSSLVSTNCTPNTVPLPGQLTACLNNTGALFRGWMADI